MTTINFANPKANYLAHKAEIDEAVARVLASGTYLRGEETEAFEEEFAKYLGVPYVVAVGNGTQALEMAFRLLPAEIFYVPSMTAVATPMAAKLARKKICWTQGWTGYQDGVNVHLYGIPTPVWGNVEDCAQACGAERGGKKVGTFGQFGCFSFYPTKNLSCLGDGGAVATKDEWAYRALLRMREYGWSEDRNESLSIGGNYRMDEIQAAILRVKLHYLDAENERRCYIAERYTEAFAELPITTPAEEPSTKAVYNLYVVRVQNRDAVLERLRTKGIICGVHYRIPCHRQPAFQPNEAYCPEADKAAAEVLSLPIWPEMHGDQILAVIYAVRWAVK